MLLLFFVAWFAFWADGKEGEVCYTGIHCIQLNRTLGYFNPVPNSPEQIDVKIYFTNRRNSRMELPSEKGLSVMPMDVAGHYTFIVHGFLSSANESWVRRMEEALIEHEETNVFSVDWSKGSRPGYFQAAANTKTVAGVVVRFLLERMEKGLTEPSKVHLIGQSLGAHLVSYIADKINGIAYITALDPAEPGFTADSPETRLDPGDALYVEVIHTNTARVLPSLSFGHNEPLGDVDFYVNGGSKQPACDAADKSLSDYFSSKLNSLIQSIGCHHMKAQEYYMEALNCTMYGLMWDLNNPDPPDGRCTLYNCQRVGPSATYFKPTNDFEAFLDDVSTNFI
ncbi:inactive pancreatic lipase-related protein 1-like isoform X2 [Cimex lectularius]|uniref:Lipase domain-containing protein n=1 Tax=Cimex lectularius TaxID=79782 RepID=A0A8I6TE65_CIMLE|nr:inactive pancreatic lipase-related protein 1-like isoform X2 [Cimex lectularius]